LLTPGGLKGARVCQSCAGGGVLIVAPTVAPVVKVATKKDDGVARALRMLRTYAAASNAGASSGSETSYNAHYQRGRAEGFEGAIEVLKRECAS